jgi:membrane protein insertase Oxa1/YidC/SpoIIIJ
MAVLLLALLVLDETIGAYHKSSKESKKQKKTEGEVQQAKKKYSDTPVKQHKR